MTNYSIPVKPRNGEGSRRNEVWCSLCGKYHHFSHRHLNCNCGHAKQLHAHDDICKIENCECTEFKIPEYKD